MKSRKIYVSLTTIPSRLSYIHHTINSIFNQRFLVDAIILSIPETSKRFTCPYDVNQINPSVFDHNYIRTIIIRCPDYGPLTKWLGPLTWDQLQDDDLIIVIDDDIIYSDTLVSNLLGWAHRYPGSVLCHIGYNLRGLPCRHPNFDYIGFYSFGQISSVDCIGGYGGVLFSKIMTSLEGKNIDLSKILLEQFEDYPNDGFFVDDDYVSMMLAINNIPRLVIPCGPLFYYDINEEASRPENSLNGQESKNIFRQQRILERYLPLINK